MMRRLSAFGLTTAVLLAAFSVPAVAQQITPTGAPSADGLWRRASDQDVPAAQRRADIPGGFAVVQLNRPALDARLAQAPNELAPNRGNQPDVIITLPLPDGRFSRFRIEESPILAPELAAAFPEIRTYRGAGLDDATATARLDLTATGFHAQIIAAGGTIYVDPYSIGDLINHVTYDKRSRPRPGIVDQVIGTADALERTYNTFPITNGTTLRTYRLALAANGEYTTVAGGSKPLALARMTTTMNRVNGIYERELAVRLTVATGTPGDPTLLIYTNPGSDPYSNGTNAINENQTHLDTVIGTANYDIGHVFTTGSGGIAQLQSVCNASGKARGTTGSGNPTGDGFDVDYVAHEMGHQFGGNHTFNGTVDNCTSPNRSAAHAYEVGSGSTIQAYAGICGNEDLQPNSDDIFNFESLNEMTAFITAGGGAACGAATATGNTVPSVTAAGAAFTIPANTPFELTATASDVNGDALTYLWEEHDLGTASNGTNAWIDDGSRPLFRSYEPTTSPTRSFPSLTYILNNANVPPTTYLCPSAVRPASPPCLTGEALPTTNRTMQFHVTVRDNRAGGGGINTAQTSVTINAATGPFAVSAPNTAVTWPAASTQTVSWTVNGTSGLAANVTILLSNDGGATFPVILAASTPNDGSETITVPGTQGSTARIKVKAIGNVFFDISNTNFTIGPPASPPGAFTKSSPGNGTSGTSAQPTISWTASTAALSYEYCVDTSSNATCDTAWVSAGNVLSTRLTALLPSTAYSWQMRAVNGSTPTLADGGTWWTFTTAALTNPQADIAIDFGPSLGLWTNYDSGGTSTWSPIHNLSPTRLTTGDLDGNGQADILANFAGYGLWAFVNNTTWTPLHPLDADLVATGDIDGSGVDDLLVTFSGYGLWVRYDSGSWLQLSGLAINTLAVGNIDGSPGSKADVVVSFPSAGLWTYRNNAAWTQDHPFSATRLAIGDVDGSGVGDVIVQFTGYGQYVYYNSTSWTLLHPTTATAFVTGQLDNDGGHRSDVVMNFPGVGVWARMNNSVWTQLHGLNADVIATGDVDGNGQADVILSFPGLGIWVYRNQTTWSQLHGLNPELVAPGRVNAN